MTKNSLLDKLTLTLNERPDEYSMLKAALWPSYAPKKFIDYKRNLEDNPREPDPIDGAFYAVGDFINLVGRGIGAMVFPTVQLLAGTAIGYAAIQLSQHLQAN